MRRTLALAASALPFMACLTFGESGTSDAGPSSAPPAAATLLPGKWGTLNASGMADPSSGYYFAANGTWGHFEAGACTAGDSYQVQGNIMALRTGSTVIDYQVDFAASNTQLVLRTPGSIVGDAASSAPTYVFGLLDSAPTHSCASL